MDTETSSGGEQKPTDSQPKQKFREYKGKRVPVCSRDCLKCGSTEAFGPKFHSGMRQVVSDGVDMGPHLRYYCVVCGYITLEPTKDTDTPARREELQRLFLASFNRGGERHDRPDSQPRTVPDERTRDIQRTFRADSRGWGHRS